MIYLVAVMSIILPIAAISAFVFGMNMGKTKDEKKELSLFIDEKNKKMPLYDAKSSRLAQILANVETYDGTNKGQTEVK